MKWFLARAEQSLKAGADGLVASAQEAELLKNKFKNKDFTLVTPGIRPANSKKDDQRRTATPKEAVEKGADYFVIGRPISTAKEPLKVIRQIKKELAMAIPPRKKNQSSHCIHQIPGSFRAARCLRQVIFRSI